MNKLALALLGTIVSASAMAQTSDSLIAGTTLTTTVVTVAVPVIALIAVTVAAESGNDTPSAPQTAPSGTTR